MKDCVCGRETRLHKKKVVWEGKRGILHWITHRDTSRVCLDGTWATTEWGPGKGPDSDRLWWRMVQSWNSAVAGLGTTARSSSG